MGGFIDPQSFFPRETTSFDENKQIQQRSRHMNCNHKYEERLKAKSPNSENKNIGLPFSVSPASAQRYFRRKERKKRKLTQVSNLCSTSKFPFRGNLQS